MRRSPLVLACAAALALGLSACGTKEIRVTKSDPSIAEGARLFNQRCSGCHTLDVAAAQGSKPTGQVSGGERTDGPNFNVRKENREDVLYAIRNGGFSGAIMPANVVMGRQAQDVALFLERYAGSSASGTSQTSSPNKK